MTLTWPWEAVSPACSKTGLVVCWFFRSRVCESVVWSLPSAGFSSLGCDRDRFQNKPSLRSEDGAGGKHQRDMTASLSLSINPLGFSSLREHTCKRARGGECKLSHDSMIADDLELEQHLKMIRPKSCLFHHHTDNSRPAALPHPAILKITTGSDVYSG